MIVEIKSSFLPNREYLIIVTGKNFVCGAIALNEKIIECAPLLRSILKLNKFPHRIESMHAFINSAKFHGNKVVVKLCK